MPELPEVETVVNGIKDRVVGKTINQCITTGKKLRADSYDNLNTKSIGKTFKKVYRKGKYIIAELDKEYSLLIHLGMSGKLTIADKLESKKHDHVSLELSNNTYLIFNDARRFGCFILDKKNKILNHSLLSTLGIEPLTSNLSPESLYKLLKNKKTNIKNFLMSSKNIVGVGNIYASESLFNSRIHPLRSCDSINKKEASLLCSEIKNVLNAAIESGGSTLRDYVRSDGDLGYFQHHFNVYGRENKKCKACNDDIEKIIISNRSTFLCNSCQK